MFFYFVYVQVVICAVKPLARLPGSKDQETRQACLKRILHYGRSIVNNAHVESNPGLKDEASVTSETPSASRKTQLLKIKNNPNVEDATTVLCK